MSRRWPPQWPPQQQQQVPVQRKQWENGTSSTNVSLMLSLMQMPQPMSQQRPGPGQIGQMSGMPRMIQMPRRVSVKQLREHYESLKDDQEQLQWKLFLERKSPQKVSESGQTLQAGHSLLALTKRLQKTHRIENLDQVIERYKTLLAATVTGATFQLYGSQLTNLQTAASDIDLGIVLANQSDIQGPRKEMYLKTVLLKMEQVLTQNGIIANSIIHAQVPIIKCVDPQTGLHLDISHLDHDALRNAELINRYKDADLRVYPLMMTVKHWSKQRGLADAAQGFLNSFGYILLLIQFLQLQEPPVVPTFPSPSSSSSSSNEAGGEVEAAKDGGKGSGAGLGGGAVPQGKESPSSRVSPELKGVWGGGRKSLALKEDVGPKEVKVGGVWGNLKKKKEVVNQKTPDSADDKGKFVSQNKETLIQLLCGFFDFYSNSFAPKVETHAVCVRTGRLVPKDETRIKVSVSSNYKGRRARAPSPLCVVDPANETNNVARSLRLDAWTQIEKEVMRARELLIHAIKNVDQEQLYVDKLLSQKQKSKLQQQVEEQQHAHRRRSPWYSANTSCATSRALSPASVPDRSPSPLDLSSGEPSPNLTPRHWPQYYTSENISPVEMHARGNEPQFPPRLNLAHNQQQGTAQTQHINNNTTQNQIAVNPMGIYMPIPKKRETAPRTHRYDELNRMPWTIGH